MAGSGLLYRLRTVTEYQQFVASFEGVEGYLHDLEGYTLLELAAEGFGVGEIVEIGSFLGRSTCWLAAGSKGSCREKVTAIDHFRGSPEHQKGETCQCFTLLNEGTTFGKFKENVGRVGLADHVEPIVAPSEEAVKGWTKPIRLLFIDGEHSYEASKRDFELWEPFVIPGGYIAFHDVNQWPGVTQFHQEMLQRSDEFRDVLTVVSLAVVQKAEKPA